MISVFWKGTVIVLLAVILSMCLMKEGVVTRTILIIAVGCMVAISSIQFLLPVISFLQQLQSIGELDQTLFGTLMKVTGIGLISQIATLICADSGMNALGKTLHLLSTAVIIWLSLPMLEGLLELIRKILGEI